ncbi:alpha/beta fold hydrolase [Mycolicibacterium sp. lyk4-40-TYG-92]|uniref:alpha/beta fold hydrolase n=1 Tax=Mycolicibacterium sp. lyk4-40-TYG-92 TaxID=3040295 RepID=UPI003305F020
MGSIDFGGPHGAPLIVCGPSLGTSVTALWSTTASRLTHHYRVIGYDLSGHGRSPAPTSPFTIADLAAAVQTFAACHTSSHSDSLVPQRLFDHGVELAIGMAKLMFGRCAVHGGASRGRPVRR